MEPFVLVEEDRGKAKIRVNVETKVITVVYSFWIQSFRKSVNFSMNEVSFTDDGRIVMKHETGEEHTFTCPDEDNYKEFRALVEKIHEETKSYDKGTKMCVEFLRKFCNVTPEDEEKYKIWDNIKLYTERDRSFRVGGVQYDPPVGWYRLKMEIDDEEKTNGWNYGYHGTRAEFVGSIIRNRLVVPGNKTEDGTLVEILPGHIPGRNQIYTSPSLHYSGHHAYAQPTKFYYKDKGDDIVDIIHHKDKKVSGRKSTDIHGDFIITDDYCYCYDDDDDDDDYESDSSDDYSSDSDDDDDGEKKVYYVRTVFQVRQEPGTYHIQENTLHPLCWDPKVRMDDTFSNDELEWFTEDPNTIIPIGLLLHFSEVPISEVYVKREEEQRRKYPDRVETTFKDSRAIVQTNFAAAKKKKILWVDDYPKNNEDFIIMIRERGVEVDLCLSTDSAIEKVIEEGDDAYCIAITDMRRTEQREGDDEPKVYNEAGLDFIRIAKSREWEFPIYLYSSYARRRQDIMHAAKEAGAEKICTYDDIRYIIEEDV